MVLTQRKRVLRRETPLII